MSHAAFDLLLAVLGVRIQKPTRVSRQDDGFQERLEKQFMPVFAIDEQGFDEAPIQSSSTNTTASWTHAGFVAYRAIIALLFVSFGVESLAIYHRDGELDMFFLRIIEDLMSMLHWYLAIDYFGSGHLESLHGDRLLDEDDVESNPLSIEQSLRSECGLTRNAMAWIVAAITFVQAAIILCVDGLQETASTPWHIGFPLNLARVMVGMILARAVVFLNCMVFSSVFIKHVQIMGIYSARMAEPHWFTPSDPDALTMRSAEVCYNVACLKTAAVGSTRRFDRMVASIVFLVPASIGCFANNVTNAQDVIVTARLGTTMALFGIVLIVMSYVILRYEELKTRMCSIVESPQFVEMYVANDPRDTRYALAMHYHLLLTELLKKSNWLSISVLGFDIADSSLPQKAAMFGGTVFAVLQFYSGAGR